MPAHPCDAPNAATAPTSVTGTTDWRDQRIAELGARVAYLEQQVAAFFEDAARLAELVIPANQLPTLAPDADIAVRWEPRIRTTVDQKAVVD